jgi:hypothetical protein
VPQAQVSNNNAAFLDEWLRRRTNFPSSVEQMLLDPSTSAVTMRTFLVSNGSSVVRAEPNFCGAVFFFHRH